MEETPKKIVVKNCFLCSFPLIPQASECLARVHVDIAHLIECAVDRNRFECVFVQRPVRLYVFVFTKRIYEGYE